MFFVVNLTRKQRGSQTSRAHGALATFSRCLKANTFTVRFVKSEQLFIYVLATWAFEKII